MYSAWVPPSVYRKRRGASNPAFAKRFKTSRASKTQSVNRRTVSGLSTRGTWTQQLKSLQRVVKKLQPEAKYNDASLTMSNITSSGTIIHLTAIAQGATSSTRNGDAIRVSHIAFRWRMDMGSFGTGNFGSRVAIVQDKQQNPDTSPTISDIFRSSNPVDALPTLTNLERFRILWLSDYLDHTMIQSGQQTNVREYTAKQSIKVEYNGANTSDIQKNGLYFVFLTNDSNNTIDGDGICRIQFTDV